jgi:hypothetical protein
MPDEKRNCKWCGSSFVWTEQEQKDNVADDATGDLLEGADPGHECKSCRIKQDGMRS